MKTIWIALFAAALSAGCSKPAEPTKTTSTADTSLSGEQLCRRDLKSMVPFKDPDSVRINSVSANPQRAGRFLMSVSAKNSMGGYGDPTTCTCGTANGAVTDIHCDSPGG